MRKILFVFAAFLPAFTASAQSTPTLTTVQAAEDMFHLAIKRVHKQTAGLVYASKLSPSGYSAFDALAGQDYGMVFLAGDVQADKTSKDQPGIAPLYAAAREYFSYGKSAGRSIGGALSKALAAQKTSRYDTTAINTLRKQIASEESRFRAYMKADTEFRKANAALYDNIIKEEVAYFLRLDPARRTDYVTYLREDAMTFLWRGFLRTQNAYYIKDSKTGQITLQSAGPDGKRDEPWERLSFNTKTAPSQIEAAMKEAGFVKSGKDWKRSSATPAEVTATEASVTISGDRFIARFVYPR